MGDHGEVGPCRGGCDWYSSRNLSDRYGAAAATVATAWEGGKRWRTGGERVQICRLDRYLVEMRASLDS
jgi:hypothetical protein